MKTQKIKNSLLLCAIMFSIAVSHCYALNESAQNSINQIIASNSGENSNLKENQRFAFILFYMQSCPHCQRFDPILRAFSDDHHIPVLAYTLDGKLLPSFPSSFNPTQAELLKFFPMKNPVVPTLFLLDQQTHKIYPLFQGEASRYQLSQRYFSLKNKIEGDQYKNNSQVTSQDFKYE